MDRQVIGVLTPTLAQACGWSEIDYSNIVAAFQIAYALGYAGAGRFIDVVGVRWGYGLAVLVWSVAAMAHGLARTVPGFCAARFALGLAEGGNFPAAVKCVSEWFPKRERALATGIFNAGSNVGALITPLVVPWITLTWGWPAAFVVTGSLGFLWLALWRHSYHDPTRHPRLSPAELAYIRSDPPEPTLRIGWWELLCHRQTWAFVLGMFLTSPIWWFYLYWIPDFLNKRHGLNLLQLGPPLVVIYLMTDVGSVGGGWLSSHLLQRGWSVNASRKTALLACAACVVPILAASWVQHLWTAVFLIGLAAAAHQPGNGWQQIDRHDRLGAHPPGRDPARPTHHARHAHPALPDRPFPLAQRPRTPGMVSIRQPGPIVGGEDDEGVALEAAFLERVHELVRGAAGTLP
jgi:ACS family hexuronate transporter-like MFS transporter